MMKRTAGLVLALAAAPLAHAVDDASFARCRGISDPGARLACYDGLPTGAPPAAVQPPPIAPSRTAPAAPPPPARTQAPAPSPPAQEFGMEQRAPAVEFPTTMETYIPGHFEGWGPNARIKLGNGQVWQVVDGSSAMFNVDNPKVVIRRGMMGGFFLEIGDSNRSPRVRRLQ
jgi:hypothetical protein